MSLEAYRVAERRLWNELVRDGVVERRALEDGLKIRKAFREALDGVKSPGQMMVAVSEILAITLSELETRQRLASSLQARVWSGIAAALDEESRQKLEHGLRTVSAKDLSL